MTTAGHDAAPEIAFPAPRVFFWAAGASLGFFGLWSALVFGTDALPNLDRAIARAFHSLGPERTFLWQTMVFCTDLGSVAGMTMLAIMGTIWQTGLKRKTLAGAWLGVVICGGLLNVGVKLAFDRDRPEPELRDRAVLETNESYPSGHSMGAAIGYGMLAYALTLPQRRRPRRIATLLLVAGLVLMIGLSRMYLRAHWFSDVIGGFSIGLAWLFFCIGLLEGRRKRVSPAASEEGRRTE